MRIAGEERGTKAAFICRNDYAPLAGSDVRLRYARRVASFLRENLGTACLHHFCARFVKRQESKEAAFPQVYAPMDKEPLPYCQMRQPDDLPGAGKLPTSFVRYLRQA